MQGRTMSEETCGFVFAVTGEKYTALARRAARSLRHVHPEAKVDLFTDIKLDDTVFSEIHMLSDSWFRPKMEALQKSRFDRTIYLDADIMVIAPLEPVFEVLDRFDVAACHNRMQNNSFVLDNHTRPLPPAFSVINGGLLALRRSEPTMAFVRDWEQAVRESNAKKDQPALRELLYDSDLKLCILPPGYNLMTFHELKTWWGMFGAPRVLHAPFLHLRREGPGDPETPFAMEEMVGLIRARRLRALIHADVTLTPDVDDGSRNMYGSLNVAPIRWLRNRVKPIYRRLRYRYR